jgi:hypothetical protein
MVEAYIIDAYHFGELAEFATDMTHMLIWFTLLQILLFIFSGASRVDADKLKEEGGDEALEEEVEVRELDLKCYATLMAHLTGFASINAWGSLQQLSYFTGNPFMSQLTVPIAFCGQWLLQQFTDFIRETVASMGDGQKDEFENLWDEETEEAENDIMGLTLSFMTVTSFRFLLVGCLPNNEGKEEPPHCPEDNLYHHTPTNMMLLWVCAWCFTGVVFAWHYNMPVWFAAEELPSHLATIRRTFVAVITSVSMCYCWCQFFGMQMILAHWIEEPETLAVALALVVSIGVFALMVGLDWLADQDWTDDRCDAGIRATIDACSLLVGFAWEQCFDQSVDAIASSTIGWQILDPHRTKLILTFFCASLLVPAWKMYMLPYIHHEGWQRGYVLKVSDIKRVVQSFLDNEQEQEEEAEKKESGAEELDAAVKDAAARYACLCFGRKKEGEEEGIS